VNQPNSREARYVKCLTRSLDTAPSEHRSRTSRPPCRSPSLSPQLAPMVSTSPHRTSVPGGHKQFFLEPLVLTCGWAFAIMSPALRAISTNRSWTSWWLTASAILRMDLEDTGSSRLQRSLEKVVPMREKEEVSFSIAMLVGGAGKFGVRG
jgi:hypothetical protein